jgi:glycosyltransferase involved in cell wall biosynthesis
MSSAPHDDSPLRTARRIAVIVDSLGDARASRVARERLRWFADAGYDVTVIPLSASRPSEDAPLPAAVHVHPLGAVQGAASQVRGIRDLLTRSPVDVVLALQTGPNLVAVAATRLLSPQPLLVLTELDLLSSGLARPGLASRLRTARAKRVYRHADLVVSSSHSIGAELSSGFGVPASRSLVVPDPVTLHPDAGIAKDAETDIVRIVVAGDIVPNARPHLAILAARELRAGGVAAEVHATGDGRLSGALTALAKRWDVPFVLHDGRTSWQSTLTSRSVVVVLDRSVGLGCELVEAAALGVPSVGVSTALGVADAVIPGITGELALDSSPEAIAEAVSAASRLDVRDIGAWLDRFSPAASGATLERAIDYAATRRAAA